MEAMAKEFIEAVKAGVIVVDVRNDHNHPEMLDLYFRYVDTPGLKGRLSKWAFSNMPEEWDYIEYAGTNGCMAYRTNGFNTMFFTCRGNDPQSDDEITLKGGSTLKVGKRWSSRAGVVYLLTGLKLAEIYCDNGPSVYIDYETAEALANILNLRVWENAYTLDDKDGEQSYGFYHPEEFYTTIDGYERPVPVDKTQDPEEFGAIANGGYERPTPIKEEAMEDWCCERRGIGCSCCWDEDNAPLTPEQEAEYAAIAKANAEAKCENCGKPTGSAMHVYCDDCTPPF